MDKVKLQFIEIFPSIAELTKNSQDLTISVSSDTNNYSRNLQKIIEEQSSIDFFAKDKSIQFALYKNSAYLGSCEYNMNNETRWVSLANVITHHNAETTANTGLNQDSLLFNLTDCIRLRIKCSLNESNGNGTCNGKGQSQSKVQIKKGNKKQANVNQRNMKDSIELLGINRNSTYYTKKERMSKQQAGSISGSGSVSVSTSSTMNTKHRKKDSSSNQSIITTTKLRNNKTCQDGFDNTHTNTNVNVNTSALLLTDIPVLDPFNRKNGSYINLQSTKSSNRYNNNYLKLKTSSGNRYNITKANATSYQHHHLKSPSLANRINTHSVQTTIVNNRNNSYENVSRYPQSYTSHQPQSNANANTNQDQALTAKLNERFKTFEDSIIDKNYENNIKNDEMIHINDNRKLLGKMINENCEENNDSLDEDFIKELTDQEEDSKSSFSSIKEDFEIFYTNEYIKAISNETIKLELQLVIDKLCDLQEGYHKELLLGMGNYEKYEDVFNHYSEKYMDLHKKYLNLKHMQERAHLSNTTNTFIVNHKLKHNSDIISINKAEVQLWNQLPLISLKPRCTDESFKKKLIGVFSVITKRNKEQLGNMERRGSDDVNDKAIGHIQYDQHHSRTRSMEEPMINYTMPIMNKTRNETKAEAKCSIGSGVIRNSHNNHNDISFKKKESKHKSNNSKHTIKSPYLNHYNNKKY